MKCLFLVLKTRLFLTAEAVLVIAYTLPPPTPPPLQFRTKLTGGHFVN